MQTQDITTTSARAVSPLPIACATMPGIRPSVLAAAITGLAAALSSSTAVGPAAPCSPALSSFGGSSLSGSSAPMLQGTPGKTLTVLKGPTQAMHLLTGAGSPQRTDQRWALADTDLGIAFTDENGDTILAFGDTVACDGTPTDWRSNTLVRTRDRDYTDGLHIDQALTATGFHDEGKAVEFIPSLKIPGIEHTTIPTAGIAVGDALYIDYMSVRSWGAPGEWVTNYAATVKSTDGGETWQLVPESLRINNSGHADVLAALPELPAGYGVKNGQLQMSALVHGDDGWIYRMSTPSGRQGQAVLARIAPEDFPDESAFTYFDGVGWQGDPSSAVPVLDGKVSELSLTYNDHLGQWVAMCIDGNGMVLRTASELTGPWPEKRMLVNTGTIPDLYGGFVLPYNDDRYLYYVATTWSSYNVMLMRTDLSEQATAIDDQVEVVGTLDFSDPAEPTLVEEPELPAVE